ncbi:hypothetical protein N9K77_01940 [bacterium]|nr:hypothetical protein [bacterium]
MSFIEFNNVTTILKRESPEEKYFLEDFDKALVKTLYPARVKTPTR